MLLLLSQLLKSIATHGFRFVGSFSFCCLFNESHRLDASVPLGPVGPFGILGRREMWIFKSISWKVDTVVS